MTATIINLAEARGRNAPRLADPSRIVASLPPHCSGRSSAYLLYSANVGIARIRRLARRAGQAPASAKSDMEMVLGQTGECIAELTEIQRRIAAGASPYELLHRPKKRRKSRKGGAA